MANQLRLTEFPAPGLPRFTRLITSHDAEGNGYFKHEDIGDHHRVMQDGKGVANIIYSTKTTPVDLNGDADILEAAANEPPLHYQNGSILRMVDFAPGVESPMHRALSIDYGIVIEGEFEITLDSGESRILKRGDIVVQRGTSHKWRNVSKTACGRMLYVLLDIEPLIVKGEAVKEYLGDLSTDYVGRS